LKENYSFGLKSHCTNVFKKKGIVRPGKNHLVKLLDSFEINTHEAWGTVLVFETLGIDLERLIFSRYLSIYMIRQIYYQALVAMDYLDKLKVLHRSKKPENILVEIDQVDIPYIYEIPMK